MRTGLTEDQIIYPYQRETRAPGHTSPGRRGVKMSKADFNWAQWLKSIILATWEAQINTIAVGGQPGQKVHKTPSRPTAGRSGSRLLS
jgi:hypothetical protein